MLDSTGLLVINAPVKEYISGLLFMALFTDSQFCCSNPLAFELQFATFRDRDPVIVLQMAQQSDLTNVVKSFVKHFPTAQLINGTFFPPSQSNFPLFIFLI